MKRAERFLLHDFLNASPLLFALLEGKKPFPLNCGFLSPSALGALALGSSEEFIGVVPSIVYPAMEGGRIIPSFCIASEGRVETVSLYANTSLHKLKKLLLDSRSRTSQVMLKLLFMMEGIPLPLIEEWAPHHDYASLGEDVAFLIIGDDNYLQKDALSSFEQQDLGAWWHRLTSEGFVHALTVCSASISKILEDEVKTALDECLVYAETHKEELFLFASQRYGVPVDVCRHYVENIIRYRFDEKAERGVKRFFQLSAKYGVIPGV